MEEAVNVLESRQILRSLRPICMSRKNEEDIVNSRGNGGDEYEVFGGLSQWDRTSVEVSVSIPTFQKWLHDEPSNGTFHFFLPRVSEFPKLRFFFFGTSSSVPCSTFSQRILCKILSIIDCYN